jgi:glutathione S-transferase
LEFEPIDTNLFDPEVRERYRTRVNPLCKIPFLEHDDHVVPESSIIIEYLDGKFPTDPPLIPAGVDRSRQARFYDRLGDLYLIERSSALFFESLKPAAAQDQALIARQLEGARVALGLFNKELSDRTYLLDDRFTMADIAPVVGAMALGNQGIDLAETPNVAAWVGRIAERPSLQRVGAEIGAALAAMAAAGEVSEG